MIVTLINWRFTMKHLLITTVLASSLAALTGCSDSDSINGLIPDSAETNTLPATESLSTGVFLDSAVEGLRFATPTTEGVTGEGGVFRFTPGEQITFYIGNSEIGSTDGYEVVTPMDLQSAQDGDDFALNILRILQTLDTDGDPSNGIILPNPIIESTLNFSQSLDAFEADPATTAFVIANTNVSVLVDEVSAATHFGSTLSTINNDYNLDITSSNWTSVITLSQCTSSIRGGFDFVVTPTGFTQMGTDSFTTSFASEVGRWSCAVGDESIESFDFNTDPTYPLDCGATCGYRELNTIEVGVDGQGRSFITTVWHVVNSDVITYTKRVTFDPNNIGGGAYTFKEVFTRI